MSRVTRSETRRLIGKRIYALRKDGTVVSGKLVAVKGDKLYVRAASGNKAHVSALVPLVLFDLLAIGTSPFGFGSPFGYGPFGYGQFDPFFWW